MVPAGYRVQHIYYVVYVFLKRFLVSGKQTYTNEAAAIEFKTLKTIAAAWLVYACFFLFPIVFGINLTFSVISKWSFDSHTNDCLHLFKRTVSFSAQELGNANPHGHGANLKAISRCSWELAVTSEKSENRNQPTVPTLPLIEKPFTGWLAGKVIVEFGLEWSLDDSSSSSRPFFISSPASTTYGEIIVERNLEG